MRIPLFDDFALNAHDGGPARFPTTNRVSVMVKPPAELADRIANFVTGADRPAALLHSVIQPLGDRNGLTGRHIENAARALSRLRYAPFLMQFDRISGGDGVALRGDLHDNCVALNFRDAVLDVLSDALGTLPAYRLDPHMMLDDRSDRPGRLLDQPIAWLIEEFMLVESVESQNRHIVHGHWRLRAC